MKNKHQLVWGVILLGAIAILIGYSIWLFMFAKSTETVVYNQGYYNSGMMGGRVNSSGCVLQDLSTQYCKEKVHTFAPEIFL